MNRLGFIGAILAVAVIGSSVVILYLERARPTATNQTMLTSIAVLPFTNVSDDPSNDYFAIGLSDELIGLLTSVPRLKVVARTSAYPMKGTRDVRDIGRVLDVQGVVEGTVRKEKETVRVAVQLFDTENGYGLWSQTYDRELNDIFSIQEEIAEHILAALKSGIGAGVDTDVMPPRDTTLQAYDLYLLGRHYLRERGKGSLEKGAQLFLRAIEMDDHYAPAYSGLAKARLLQAAYGELALEKAVAAAEPAIIKALGIDEELAEAHVSLGILRFLQNDYHDAELNARRAIQLDPSQAFAHMGLALSLAYRDGQLLEAQQHYEEALRLDPLDVTLQLRVAYNLTAMGRYDEALAGLENAARIYPRSDVIQLAISQVAADSGRLDLSYQSARAAMDLQPNNGRAMTMLAYTLATVGDAEAASHWLTLVDRTKEPTSRWYVNLARIAIYFATGNLQALHAVYDDADTGRRGRDPILFMAPEWARDPGIGNLMLFLEDYPAAIGHLQEHLDSHPGLDISQGSETYAFTLGSLAYAYGKMDRGASSNDTLLRARTTIDRARHRGWNSNMLAYDEARILAMQGELEPAFGMLKRSLDQGFCMYWLPPLDPIWKDHADHPAFQAILRDIERRLHRSKQLVENAAKRDMNLPASANPGESESSDYVVGNPQS